MTDLIESRIKAIKEGKLPEGYKRTKAGIMPVDWDGTIQAKKLFKKHTDKKHDGDLEILAATQERGIVPRSQIGIDIQCSDEGVKGYKKVSKGDFVISLRSFQGGIEYSEYTGIISPAYTVLKPIKDISTGFYRNYFKTDMFIKRLNGAVYGIRDGKQIGYEDFGDMYVHCPPLAEQERITEILTQCDHVIELKEQKLDELKQLKKEFLRKMFPAKGCDTPEIRFPGFTGAWEQRKLGDVCEIKDSARIPNSEWTESGVPYIRASDVTNENIDGVLFISQERYEFYKNRTGAPTKDDVLFNGGGEIGKCLLIADENPIYVQGGAVLYACTSESSKLVGQYLKIYFETTHAKSYIDTASAGGTMKHFTLKPSQMMPILIPSVDEQEKLGTYFFNLDHLMTLHQRELEETKTYKKTLAKLLLTGIVRVQG